MATVTKGKTFISGETVEPADMHQLVDSATVTFTTASDTDDSTLEVSGNKFRAKDGGITVAKLAAATVERLLPAGAVMPFAMNSAPSGWLAADGTEYSKTGTYAALFAAIGTTHGETNGSGGAGTSHFRVPDLRGIFVRGSGSQTISGITYNKTFAAKEGDAMQGHRHTYGASYNTYSVVAGSAVIFGNASSNTTNDPVSDGTNGTPRTASETRPANIALLYCIKH